MATLAVGRKPSRLVVRITCSLVVGRVTGITRGGSADVVSPDGPHMTSVAVHSLMGPDERQSRRVVLLPHPRLIDPSGGRVALGADRTEATAMSVVVAINALGTHVGKDRLLMAVATLGMAVHALEWVARRGMIKITGARQVPGFLAVAQLAIQIHRAVRVADAGQAGLILRRRNDRDDQQ